MHECGPINSRILVCLERLMTKLYADILMSLTICKHKELVKGGLSLDVSGMTFSIADRLSERHKLCNCTL